MRQKLGVALAVAVLALAGARETCKQFNQLKSLAGEWSGVWGTMLVYAGAYAEGEPGRRQALAAASGETPCPGETTLARTRRAGAKVRQTPRASREGAGGLTTQSEELALGFAAGPEPEAAADEDAGRRAVEAAEELASAAVEEIALVGGLVSAFEAELARAGVMRETAHAGRAGKSVRVEKRLVLRLPEPPRAGARSPRAGESAAAAGEWPAAEDAGGPAGLGEGGEFFAVPPPPGSGLLNCDTQPRR